MDNESTARLKFDRRLATRRGWVEPDELEQELASLPDAADKMVPLGEPGEGARETSADPAAPPAAGVGPEGGTPQA
jgi:hypothetical protein